MNCERAQSIWHDKCDNLLSQSDALSLEFHLRQCDGCRQFHREMDAMADGLDELRVLTESVAMPARLPQTAPRAGRWWRAVGSVAAMLAVVVSAALWSGRDDPGSTGGGKMNGMNGQAGGLPASSVEMIGQSHDRYIPVRSETHQPGVQFFVLYEQPADGDS